MSDPTATGDRSRILILEDEEQIARTLKRALVREGYEVRTAGSLAEFETQIAAEACDLVTVDLLLPDGNGMTAVRRLQDCVPPVGALVVTGNAESSSAVEAMRAGALGYVMKPFRISLLLQEIDRAIEFVGLQAENRSYRDHLEQRVADQAEELQEAFEALQCRHRQLVATDRMLAMRMAEPSSHEQLVAELLEVIGTAIQSPWGVAGKEGGLQTWTASGSTPPLIEPRPGVCGVGEAFFADDTVQLTLREGDTPLRLLFDAARICGNPDMTAQLARDAALTVETQECAVMLFDIDEGDLLHTKEAQ